MGLTVFCVNLDISKGLWCTRQLNEPKSSIEVKRSCRLPIAGHTDRDRFSPRCTGNTFIFLHLIDKQIIVLRFLIRYGDRAPKSFLARIFCIVWILVGIIIIAIFTAIVTASLSASIQHHFTVHGSLVSSHYCCVIMHEEYHA